MYLSEDPASGNVATCGNIFICIQKHIGHHYPLQVLVLSYVWVWCVFLLVAMYVDC